jgi:flagellin-specific chaperone FliS
MKLTHAYTQSQNLTLDGEAAFEELYTRLARWSREAAENLASGDFNSFEALAEKSLSLLGFMDRCIDLSGSYEIATRILSLHRFVIGALVRAKAERNAAALSELPEVFVSLAEIFTAIRSTRGQSGNPAAGEKGAPV